MTREQFPKFDFKMILQNIKELIQKSNKITLLTGAGMSTESGISDFRSPGGVWSRYKTVTIQEFVSNREKRIYYWKYKSETIPSMLKAKPNHAHLAIGKLDQQKKIFWLLTQNIDGLDEKGGVSKKRIVRLHGNNTEAICLSCSRIIDIKTVLQRIDKGEAEPRCEICGGLLKPNTVSFGQGLNPEHVVIAEKASRECDLFMSLGTSLQVFPANSFVDIAHSSGRPVIIINRDPTPYDDLATYRSFESLARILPMII